MTLLLLLRGGAGATNLNASPAVVRLVAVAPALSVGAVSLVATAAVVRVLGVAPAVGVGALALALGVALIRILAIAPALSGGAADDGWLLFGATMRRRRAARPFLVNGILRWR